MSEIEKTAPAAEGVSPGPAREHFFLSSGFALGSKVCTFCGINNQAPQASQPCEGKRDYEPASQPASPSPAPRYCNKCTTKGLCDTVGVCNSSPDYVSGGTTPTTSAIQLRQTGDSMNTERLLKLADFLEKMPKAKFNFDLIMVIGAKDPAEALAAGEYECGTAGCAIGWMPAVFPELVEWDMWGAVTMRKSSAIGKTENFAAAREVFDLTAEEVDFLFLPYGSSERCNHLSRRAAAAEVAAHIRRFVEDPNLTYPDESAE